MRHEIKKKKESIIGQQRQHVKEAENERKYRKNRLVLSMEDIRQMM